MSLQRIGPPSEWRTAGDSSAHGRGSRASRSKTQEAFHQVEVLITARCQTWREICCLDNRILLLSSTFSAVHPNVKWLRVQQLSTQAPAIEIFVKFVASILLAQIDFRDKTTLEDLDTLLQILTQSQNSNRYQIHQNKMKLERWTAGYLAPAIRSISDHLFKPLARDQEMPGSIRYSLSCGGGPEMEVSCIEEVVMSWSGERWPCLLGQNWKCLWSLHEVSKPCLNS